MPDENPLADSSVDCIPGMGPIRTRALRKAGWETVERLRKATLADLIEVPGITEIKARQILDYLAGTEAANGPAARRPLAKPAASVGKRQGGGKAVSPTTQRQSGSKAESAGTQRQSGGKPPHSKAAAVAVMQQEVSPAAEAAGPLNQAACQVGALAESLLMSKFADEFTPRFAKQVSRLGTVAEKLAARERSLRGESEVEFARAQLARAAELLADAATRDRLGTARQEKLAEAMRDRRRKLEGLLPPDKKKKG